MELPFRFILIFPECVSAASIVCHQYCLMSIPQSQQTKISYHHTECLTFLTETKHCLFTGQRQAPGTMYKVVCDEDMK